MVNDSITIFNNLLQDVLAATPKEVIAGLADGGDFLAPLSAVISTPIFIEEGVTLGLNDIAYGVSAGLVASDQNDILNLQLGIATNQFTMNLQNAVKSLGQQESKVQGDLATINQAQVALNGAEANYQALLAQGNPHSLAGAPDFPPAHRRPGPGLHRGRCRLPGFPE